MPPSSPPERVLFLRLDTYGDIILFEPVLRLMRHCWPQTEIAVLIREPYLDITPLIAQGANVRWLSTTCDPYRQSPESNYDALESLRNKVTTFSPDLLVSACFNPTWLDDAVASFLPTARQARIEDESSAAPVRADLKGGVSFNGDAVHWEKIPVESNLSDWEKNLRLAGALLGIEASRWWPFAQIPAAAATAAAQVVADLQLAAGEYVACCAAGTANVGIKAWPAENYGKTLAWLEAQHGIKALLIGHQSERHHLDAVANVARNGGASPAMWLGKGGDLAMMAGLVEKSRFYFGNDTGALHLSAALGKPVAGVYGGGTWPRFLPVARRSIAFVQKLPCFGCGWECHFVDAPCVRTLSVDAVQEGLSEFLTSEIDGARVFEAGGLSADVRALIEASAPRLRFERRDSLDRLNQIQQLTSQVTGLAARLEASDADRRARLLQVEEMTASVKELGRSLEQSDADRDRRLRQVEDLAARLSASELDRDARLKDVQELSAQLAASEVDRAARLQRVDELTAQLTASEADREARMRQIEELTNLLLKSEEDRAARGKLLKDAEGLLAANHVLLLGQTEENRRLTAKLTPLLPSVTP